MHSTTIFAQSLAFLLSPWGLCLIGLCVGSFLNVVIYRVPVMLERAWLRESADMLTDAQGLERASGWTAVSSQGLAASAAGLTAQLARLPSLTLSLPRSRCPLCGHQIAWHENIPLLGWLKLGGRCAGCKAPISWRYPAVEAFTAAVFVLVALRFGATPQALLWCGFAATLIALAGIDADTLILPDAMCFPLLWAGLVLAAFDPSLLGHSLHDAVIGAATGYLALWSLFWAFKLATGREGMGYGDFKLMAALGAWMGWTALPVIALFASGVGLLAALVMKLGSGMRKINAQDEVGSCMPFGPCLAGGALVVLLMPPALLKSWFVWL